MRVLIVSSVVSLLNLLFKCKRIVIQGRMCVVDEEMEMLTIGKRVAHTPEFTGSLNVLTRMIFILKIFFSEVCYL